MKAKHWYDYLWVYAILYFALGFFNILFAWLGMIDFLLPLFLAIFGGNKFFCNHLCGRGQLFSKLGTDLKCSRCKPTPRWMSSKWFRYGFLLFFLTMFGNMVFQTYLVAAGATSLRETIKLLWTFRVPWGSYVILQVLQIFSHISSWCNTLSSAFLFPIFRILYHE